MSYSRRSFLKKSGLVASGVALTGSGLAASAVKSQLKELQHKIESPWIVTSRGRSPILSVVRRDDTTMRYGGEGDGHTMTWAADDRQLIALEDGGGFGPDWHAMRPEKGSWNSRLLAVRGGPQGAAFETVPGYPELPNLADESKQSRYYGFGTLALDGYIYQYLSTLDRPPLFNHPEFPGSRWIGAKLIYSPDNGVTWRNQDGSTPVIWEPWEQRSRKNMVFFKESQDAFSLLTFLQMGRNYEYNRDGYLYVYSPNGNTDGTMNELVMFRVPKRRILDRRAYEYFCGFTTTGKARWTKDIGARTPVHSFPRGWVNEPLPRTLVFESWVPSITYNAALGLYLMAGSGAGPGPDGRWFAKPSYLGFWIAQNPWGPWTQIHEETAWLPEGDVRSRAGDLQIAPKWIAADGKSFWLVWADFRGIDKPESKEPTYYSFNTQRVDLVLA